MKLFYSETMNPRKACAVARYLELPVEFVHVDLGKGEQSAPDYVAMNPNCKVPVLQDGDRYLWESNAIMCYLADKAGSDLWPKDERQIDVIRWLSWDSEHFTHYAGTLYFEYIIKQHFGMGAPDAAEVEAATRSLRRFATVLNDHLHGRQYLVGDRLSVADFAVAITLPYAEKAHIPIEDFPEIVRWHDRLNSLPAWREPFPQMAEAA
ncbi:MAG: glutathione S-transferase family protein [Phyllobacterium sp.]